MYVSYMVSKSVSIYSLCLILCFFTCVSLDSLGFSQSTFVSILPPQAYFCGVNAVAPGVYVCRELLAVILLSIYQKGRSSLPPPCSGPNGALVFGSGESVPEPGWNGGCCGV